MTLTFKPDSALVRVNDQTLKIGLNGVYQVNEAPAPYTPPQAPELLRGQWTREDTFAVEYFMAGMSERYTAAIYFDGDQMTIRQYEIITGSQIVVRGHAG